jgi:hypothetical protein
MFVILLAVEWYGYHDLGHPLRVFIAGEHSSSGQDFL